MQCPFSKERADAAEPLEVADSVAKIACARGGKAARRLVGFANYCVPEPRAVRER
jgi:hypothetical protein